MEIEVNKEDLSEMDCGGGFRTITAKITIDSTLPPRRQKIAVIYETLAALLSPALSHEAIEELADAVIDALDQFGG